MPPITSNRAARRLLTTSTLAQLPLATLSIALLVHTARLTGSVATAGLVSGAYAAALGVGGPVVGRLADRRGQTGLLVVGAGASTVLLLTIALLPAGTSAGVIAVLAAALGVCTPPVAACLRAALPDVVADPGQLRSVISLQATLSEFAWIGGPPLTLGVAAVVSTRAALMVAAGGLLLGTAAFAREPASRAWRPALERAASRGALAAPGMRTLTIVLTAVGVVFGAVEVGVAAGQGAGAGPLLGLWGAGSLLGGAAATRLGGGARTPVGLARVLAALAAGHLALALAGGSGTALGVLLVVAGAAIAPTYATVYAMVDDIAPKGTLTEASAWLATAVAVGAALGSASAGVAIEHARTTAAFILAGGAGGLSVMITLARAGTLGRCSSPTTSTRLPAATASAPIPG
jgi:Major Facilitator Superfamily